MIRQVLEHVKPAGQHEAKEGLRMAYDIDFGIFDHRAQALKEQSLTDNPENAAHRRPLALVELHPAEDWAGRGTYLDRLMRKFADLGVGTLFNVSFSEFLDFPVEYTRKMMKIAEETAKTKSDDAARQAKEREEAEKKG